MKKFLNEFKEFAMRGNVIDMANSLNSFRNFFI